MADTISRKIYSFVEWPGVFSSEVLDQLYVALDESYISQKKFNNLHNEEKNVERAINGYIGFLKEQQFKYRK